MAFLLGIMAWQVVVGLLLGIINHLGEWVKGFAHSIGHRDGLSFSPLDDSWFLLSRIPNAEWSNPIYKEANNCANALARSGAKLLDDFVIVEHPLCILLVLNQDAVSCITFRHCTGNASIMCLFFAQFCIS